MYDIRSDGMVDSRKDAAILNLKKTEHLEQYVNFPEEKTKATWIQFLTRL